VGIDGALQAVYLARHGAEQGTVLDLEPGHGSHLGLNLVQALPVTGHLLAQGQHIPVQRSDCGAGGGLNERQNLPLVLLQRRNAALQSVQAGVRSGRLGSHENRVAPGADSGDSLHHQ
jgi:hypothetical protein